MAQFGWPHISKPDRGAMIDWTAPLARGLAEFWPINEGGPYARDIAGGAKATPMATAPTPVASPYGSALSFTSTTGCGLTTTASVAPASWTLAVAVNIASSLSYCAVFVDSSGIHGFYVNALKPTFFNGTALSSTATLAAGTWHVIAVSYSAGAGTFYVDGVPAGTYSATTPWLAGSNQIGSEGGSADHALNGSLSWLGLWSRALSPAEHAAIGASPNAIWRQLYRPRRAPYLGVAPPPGGWTLLQATGVQATTPATTPLAFASNVTAGSLLVVAVGVYGTTSTGPPTDSRGNTYTLLNSQHNVGDATFALLYSATAATSGPNTVTVPYAGTDFFGFAIAEFSAGGGGFSADGAAVGVTGNSATYTAGSLPIAGTDLVLSLIVPQGNLFTTGWTPGAGYTAAFSMTGGWANNQPLLLEYLANTTASPATPSATGSATTGYAAVSAAWKLAGAIAVRVPIWHLFRGSNAALMDTP